VVRISAAPNAKSPLELLKYLHNLATLDVYECASHGSSEGFALFLSARGRVLFEGILAPIDEASARWMAAGCARGTQGMRGPAGISRETMVPASSIPAEFNVTSSTPRGFFLSVPTAVLPLVLQHLQQYNLRRKVVVEDVSAEVAAMQVVPFRLLEEMQQEQTLTPQQRAARMTAWAQANETERRDDLARLLGFASPTDMQQSFIASPANAGAAVLHAQVDPRARSMGVRLLCRKSAVGDQSSSSPSSSSIGLPASFLRVSDAHFAETFRVLQGVPRSPVDIVADKSLPLELGLRDVVRGGVSFEKGCYLGQELTARTHFQGVLRKRVWPAFVGTTEGGKLVAPVGQPPLLSMLMPAPDAPVPTGAESSVPAATDASELAWKQLQHYFPFLNLTSPPVKPDTPILRSASVAAGAAPASPPPAAKEAAVVLSAQHNVLLSLLRTEHVYDAGHTLHLQPTSLPEVAEREKQLEQARSGNEAAAVAGSLTVTPFKPTWWMEDAQTEAAAEQATKQAPDAATAATA
jgi:folate-binding protein YgfZ